MAGIELTSFQFLGIFLTWLLGSIIVILILIFLSVYIYKKVKAYYEYRESLMEISK